MISWKQKVHCLYQSVHGIKAFVYVSNARVPRRDFQDWKPLTLYETLSSSSEDGAAGSPPGVATASVSAGW